MPKETLASLVDPAALERWLASRLPGDGSAIELRRHQAGHSCETFYVRRGEQRMVLRRPPLPPYLPTAHDVAREFRVLDALKDTPVPVPRPLAICTDETVIGAPFYVMEEVEGHVIRDHVPFPLEERRAVAFELVDALGRLHAVDHRAAGLEDFGRSDGYVERQVDRWTRQLEGAASVTRGVRDLPDYRRIAGWLALNVPAPSGSPSIVHGDYKLDNVMYAPSSSPRLVAIFDWEMSTIGEPLADLGWMLSSWREAGDPPSPRSYDARDATRAPGFPRRDELLARYEEQTGRSVRDIAFYIALATWKLGIILEGSFARHLRGTTDDPTFPELERAVPEIGARALEIITPRSTAADPPSRNSRRGLVVDFGGVLTTPVLDSYLAFCESEGLDVRDFRHVLRKAYREAEPDDPIVQFELGTLDLPTFEARLASILSEGLGRSIVAEGIAARILGSTVAEPRMIGAVRAARHAGVHTGLLSNSWGSTDYPAELLELFEVVVISARVQLRKPDSAIFERCLADLGLGAEECVFVDDARPNCEAAEALGMRAILHRDPEETIPILERELGVALR